MKATDMINTPGNGLLEAARLTRAGRLAEATVVIQRALGGQTQTRGSEPEVGKGSTTVDVQGGPKIQADGSRPEPAIPGLLRGLLDKVGLRGAQGRAASSPAAETMPQGPRFLSATFTNQAGRRPYKLYVPGRYRPGQPIPLVVMLHGCTQSPDDFAAGTRMNEAAEQQTVLVVYPGQTGSANMQKCWNWFHEGDQHRNAGEPSLIAGITREVMRTYAVDPCRVYVAGLSAGGATAAIMGDAYSDLYAAIGVHSGLACGAARDLPSAMAAMRTGHAGRTGASAQSERRAVPAIVFHGDRDTTVSPRNADAVAAQSAGAAPLTKRTEDGQVPGGHAYSRTIRADANGQTVVEQWVIHGGSHAWSGGSPSGSYTDSHGPDATCEMLRFFLEHPHPSPAAAD